ncbi:vacuolar protein sorting-associated protein 13 [Xylaria sp. CBS 124048]|nr:vacuolar protein sorting-associated protein 13 [Xylaria sp. CBS 124048]
MLEGLVAGLLNRFLGMYVKNFDPTQLKVGIWSGDVKLRDLQLRREALDQLKLPINVMEGYLGELTLTIPWSNLRGAPVKVFIQDVFLLASPKEEAAYDADEEDRRKQRIKMEKLDSAELIKERAQEGLSQEEQKKSQSFTESLVTKIVDNLQVTIKNIHVRYEDSISAPGHPFALGVTLEEFSAISTNGEWEPTFIQNTSKTTHKLAKLSALAVYWNTDSELLGSGREVCDGAPTVPHDEMMQKFKAMIGDGEDTTGFEHQYILKPVTGLAKIELDKSGDTYTPKFKANLLFDEIGIVLDDDQYRDALMMADLFHYFIRHQEYKRFQPKGVTPKEDPRAWLRFAGDAVLSKIHERNRRWTWDYFRERRDDRLRYIELFKKKASQQLSVQETDEINKLEFKLTYDDLRFWRSLARNQLRKENAAALKNAPPKEQQQGWISWVWGSKPAETTDTTENTQITEEQRQELYEAIDWDEKAALADTVDYPRDAIQLQVDASLSTGSFTLRQSPHISKTDLLSLHFDVFKASAIQRTDSLLADISLGDFRVNDGTTPDSLFKEIVRVKDAPDGRRQQRLSIAELETSTREAFFDLQVEQNPLDGQGDFAVTAKLKPLEIVWNPNFVLGIVDFFKPPERHMESITALMESAGATVEGLRQQTRSGLVFALEEHKTINAKLDLQAPLIIIPHSIKTKNSTCLILDAGHISLNSELVDKGTLKQVQDKQRQKYSDEDFKQLESLMYDRFLVKLTSTQVLIGPSIEETKAQLIHKDERRMFHVVDKINVDFVVALSILPKAPNLTKVKISGHMPVLQVTVSDTKYKSLMKLIEVAIPKFGNEGQQTTTQSRPKRPRLLSTASTRSHTGHGRKLSSSLFLAQESAIILEDESDNDSDEFEDAEDGNLSQRLKIQQRNFELKFAVDKLHGSLYRSDPDGRQPDSLLVELVAEAFALDVFVRPFDLGATVSLGSLTVDDFVDNPSAEFKSIVSSGDVEDRQQQRELVLFKFTKVSPQSPEFMPVYEGIETNINVAVSTINIIITRKTLLTLLDFILITFASNSGADNQSQKRIESPGERSQAIEIIEPGPSAEQMESGSIRVKVDLKTIRMILNNDGIRLATLSFNQADVGVFITGKTMRVAAKLGDLTLVDDVNVGAAEDSSFRQLITIQGHELADFRYETFDPSNDKVYPGYDTSIFLRAGSIKVNFLEEPFRKIIEFLVKFGKMQAIYNAARQAAASQAQQLQHITSKFKFDIIINTPIIVFPRPLTPGRSRRDLVTAYLGEIYAQNTFVPLDDSESAEIAMKLSAGIRNIRLTSSLCYPEDQFEELEMIDHVDLGFRLTYAEHREGWKRPDTEIEGSLTDVNLRITQYQLRYLLEISRSVPAAFATNTGASEEEAERDVDQGTLRRAKTISSITSSSDGRLIDLSPELGSRENTWTKLDVVFAIHKIGLELINAHEDRPVGDADAASLSRFSLDDSKLKLRMLANNSLEAEFMINSFTINDSRAREGNRYKRIMTSSNKDVQQFMATVSMAEGPERSMIAVVAIDSPRIIFALDYIFSIQKFISVGLQVDEPAQDEAIETPTETPYESDAESMQTQCNRGASRDRTQTASPDNSAVTETPKMSVAFRLNIVDAQVILIANPLSNSSEAIVLGTKQVSLSQQHALTFQVSEVGMFLCRMDRFDESRLRVLDDFSLQVSMDSSRPLSTNIHIDVEPLILRLSLRDILLVLQIISKASELSGDEAVENPSATSNKKIQQTPHQKSVHDRSTSGKGHSAMTVSKYSVTRGSNTNIGARNSGYNVAKSSKAPHRHEELTATLEGIRVVLIGDIHELPIVDLSIKNLTASAVDWSTNLKAETAIDMYINVYNFAKSAWEPLLEPWEAGLGVSKDFETGRLSVELTSKHTFDVTITTATIALASKSFSFLTQDEDILGKPRGVEAPYKIRNYTGFDVMIQAKSLSNEEIISLKLTDGEEAPWSFEHWEKMRENVMSESTTTNKVSVQIEGSGFDPVKNIPLNREGEFLYSLRPKMDNTVHRFLVEVTLGTDNIKYVTLRSPLVVENQTQIPFELGVYDAQEGHLLKIEKISPGESRPAPVAAAYVQSLLVRPDSGFGYAWSSEHLWWKDLLKRPTRTLVCKGENGDPFYIQLNADYDKGHFLTGKYPYMRLKLSPPIVLENLLPFDFKYRIYDKNTKRDWSNFLRKGGVSPVHVVELSHLLLLSVDMQDTVFKASEFAIINSGSQEDFRKEHKLICKDTEGLSLHLKLHYFKIPNAGGAFKVTIYSPYVILNKTGLEVAISGKQFLQQAKRAAGLSLQSSSEDGERPKAKPLMFSFGNEDQGNRALLKFGESEWSKPQSFDAIGSTTDVALQSPTRQTELHVGITIESGEGKYKLTKVVTLAPRFVVKNKIGELVNVREPRSSNIMTLESGALQPLYWLQKSQTKQIALCYPGMDNQWSSPVNISDLGTTHVKIARAGQRQRLIRVEILMEDATIFLHLSMEKKAWPFSMRNESDTEFIFYQANPNVDEDGVEDRSGWRPIRYRLPSRSIMPYAWDFPAAKFREVVINALGRERHVKLAEIGNQVPMRFVSSSGTQKIIDISVAADGPTQTLILSNFHPKKSVYKQKTQAGSNAGTTNGFEVKKQDTETLFHAALKLSGFGISLINQQMKELAYITFRDVHFRYNESPLYQTISTSIKWIQIDNQLYGGLFPMIMYPSVVPKQSRETELHPSLHAMITRVKDDSYGVLYVKYATILLQQMTIDLDEDFIYAVLDFSKVPGASWSEALEDNLCGEDLNIPEPKQDESGQDIYFEVLNIQPMQLDLSFMRTERVNIEDKTSSRNPIMFFVNVMTMAIGNVNDAPIRLNALLLENARVSIPVLSQNISNHYSQEVLYQVHKIIGSADFLGNPVGLFNSISSGITDVFYEPYQGLIMSDKPEDLGLGIAKGAASFVKKAVYGFSDSFSKMTGSFGKGLAAATLDKQFQDRRRITRARNRPKHALFGVTAGANSFLTSIASGIGGVARKPLEGAEQEGAVGFLKGVGKGFIGLATKPAVGVFDLASNVSEGIRNTTTVFDGAELDRVRIARFVPADGIVRPYNQREALGQSWLKQVDNGKYFNESYIAHIELPREDMVVMVTYSRILLIRSRRLSTEWDVPLQDIQTIAKERTGLSIILRGGLNGPFIPIAEESGRAFLYRMVAIAVEEFNRRFRGLE